jgi:tRNA1Val (adenine37-N6)-methyltransferase
MPNTWFNFKQFKVWQRDSAFKVGTDGVLLGAWCDIRDAKNILDIGSGTGLLALMAAQRSEAQITAIEPDSLSAAEATLNSARSPWRKRIAVIRISLQDFVIKEDKKFDHIITNPPFFRNSLANSSERKSMARHDLTLGSSELLDISCSLLDDTGRLSLVLPYTEANLFIAEASEYGLYCTRMLNIKPLPSSPVKRILMEFCREKKMLSSGIMVIESGGRHQYSHEYRSLTRDFYLEF